MKQTKRLEQKITKIENRIGLRGSPDIPPGVQTVYFFNQKEGQPDEEVEAERAKKKAELVEKYGNRILSKLQFITFQIVSAKGMRRAGKTE